MPGDNSQLLRIYLSRLVRSLIPQDLGEEYITTVFDELLGFIESDNQEGWYDIQQVLGRIKSRCISNGNVASWESLKAAVDQISKFKSSESIAKYLIFLDSLKDQEEDNLRHRAPTRNGIPVSRGNLSHLESSTRHGDTRSISESFYGGNGVGDSFEHINFDRFSDRRSIYSATQNKSIDDSKNYTMEEILIPYFERNVKDAEILKYISFTLMGTTSKLFPLHNGKIELPEHISNSESGLLHNILECALIYQRLTQDLESVKRKKVSSPIKNGVMTFISEELMEYTRFVNQVSTKQSFSSLSLLYELMDQIVKLRFMFFFSQKIFKFTGFELLSLAYDYTKHGDATIRFLSLDLLRYSIEPFSKSLRSWLVNGELVDKSGEFFIEGDFDDHSLSRGTSVTFQHDRVPSFFTSSLGFKTYVIGKTANFLKTYCKEAQWCDEFSQELDFNLKKYLSETSHPYTDYKFSQLIEKHYNSIISFFTTVIYTKFHLIDILSSLKNFLLMGKGDFIQSIIQNGRQILNDPSSSLSGPQLTKLLQGSVFATTIRHKLNRYDENNVINNLDARILDIGHGNIGWDVFTLDYQLVPAVNLILNNNVNEHKKDYLRIFNYLWKFKRLETLLSDEWCVQRKQKRRFSQDKLLFKRINRVRLIQNFLRGFVLSIEKFILEEIIDTNYKKLLSELASEKSSEKVPVIATANNFKVAKGSLKPSLDYLNKLNPSNINNSTLAQSDFEDLSIDALQTLHVEYLHSITKHKLINGSDSGSKGKISKKFYINQLNNLTNLVFKFVVTVKEFNAVVVELDSQLKYDDSIDGIDDGDLNGRSIIIYNNLLELFDEFNSNLKIFINDLSNDDDDLTIRFLGISLNQ